MQNICGIYECKLLGVDRFLIGIEIYEVIDTNVLCKWHDLVRTHVAVLFYCWCSISMTKKCQRRLTTWWFLVLTVLHGMVNTKSFRLVHFTVR